MHSCWLLYCSEVVLRLLFASCQSAPTSIQIALSRDARSSRELSRRRFPTHLCEFAGFALPPLPPFFALHLCPLYVSTWTRWTEVALLDVLLNPLRPSVPSTLLQSAPLSRRQTIIMPSTSVCSLAESRWQPRVLTECSA